MRQNHLSLSSKTFSLLFLSLLLLTSCGGDSTSSIDSDTLITENHGVAQKGPFAIGSQVDIEKLDSVGIANGEKITTTVSEKNGKFSYQPPDGWNNETNIQFQVEGFTLDEAKSSLSRNKTSLLSIGNSSQKQVSINVLTHLITLRAKVLLAKGNDLNASLKQSEQELAKIFGINNTSKLDYSSLANHLLEDNASLLLLSGALMEVADQYSANVQVIIDQMADDFANDGLIDKLGDDWLKKLQATIRDNPASHVAQYSRTLKDILGIETVLGRSLPEVINIASRPVSVLLREIFAEPNETIILDGSESHDNSEKALINFTWFRVDQQSQFVIPFSDRFAESPSITTPNVEPAEFLFALVVTDEDKLTDTSVIKVIVRTPDPTNTPPVANDQSFNINEDTTALNFNLNASDGDGDPLAYNISTPLLLPNSIILGTPPALSYRPDLNFNGTSRFTYTVNDGNRTSNTATISINVLPINDIPIANPQNLVTNKNEAITNIILTGSDVDVGDTLTFSVKNSPEHGSLVGTSPNHSYTPDTDFAGVDSFSFVVNDGTLDSAEAVVNITVDPINTDPTAVNDNFSSIEEESAAGNVLINDTDPDGDILTVTSAEIDIDNSGTIEDIAIDVIHTLTVSGDFGTRDIGTIKISTNGDFEFNPTIDFNGSVPQLTYTISDGKGGTEPSATLNISITPVNDAPTARSFTLDLNQGSSISVPVGLGVKELGGSDPEDDTLTVTDIESSSSAVYLSGLYTPNTDICGEDTMKYKVFDGDLKSEYGIITFNINCKPIAITQHIDLNAVSLPLDIILAGTDLDGNLPLTYKVTELPVSHSGSLFHGSTSDDVILDATFASPSVRFEQAGSVATPNNFSFTVIDSKGLESDSVTIYLSKNSSPIARGRANVGEDPLMPVTELNTVVLIGEDSTDDSAISNYLWKQIDIGANDPTVSLTPTTTGNVTFDAPVPTVDNVSTGSPLVLKFRLTVTDDGTPELQDSTTTSNPDSVRDDVLVHINARPVANAGGNRTWEEGKEITLQGLRSYDLEGDITYQWTQASGTSVGLSSGYTTVYTRKFKAPAVDTGTTDTLVFDLTVRDENGVDSVVDSVTMTVEDDVCFPPVADAGVDRDVSSGNRITLIGGGTVDRCGTSGDGLNHIINYNWVQVDSNGDDITPTVAFDDSTVEKPRFNAPTVTSGFSSIYFKLIVEDFFNSSLPDFVKIDVYPTGVINSMAPIAAPLDLDIGASGFIKSIHLSGTDPDGDDSALIFTIDTYPDSLKGSLSTLQYYGQAFYTPVFSISPDQPVVSNSFTFTVMDQDGLISVPALVNLVPKTPPSGNLPPVALDKTIVLPVSSAGVELDFISPDVLVSDPENDFIRMYEVSRAEVNVSFTLRNYSSAKSAKLTAKNNNIGSIASNTYEYILVDEYGQKSNTATITIEFVP